MTPATKCGAALGLLTFALLLPTAAGDPPKPAAALPAADAAPKAGAKPPQLELKIFTLARANPTTVADALNELLEEATVFVPDPPAKGKKKAMEAVGFGGNLGGIGGNIGCGFGGGPGKMVVNWKAATDDTARVVAVRGSARHLAVAADVVAVLDREAKAPVPATSAVRTFLLTHATANTVSGFVSELDFPGVRMHLVGEKLLLCTGPDEATKSVAEVVKALDVPAKGEGK